MPSSPPARARTCQWVQPGSPMSSFDTCAAVALRVSSISSINRRLPSSARPRSSSAARPRRTCSTARRATPPVRRGSADGRPRAGASRGAGRDPYAARPSRRGRPTPPPTVAPGRAACGARRARPDPCGSERRDVLCERASRQWGPSGSIPRRSACRPSRPVTITVLSTIIARGRPDPHRPAGRCSRSSTRPAITVAIAMPLIRL